MKKYKHPPVVPHPDRQFERTDVRTWQLGMAAWPGGNGEWTALHRASKTARENLGLVYTGYFDPKSELVKTSGKED